LPGVRSSAAALRNAAWEVGAGSGILCVCVCVSWSKWRRWIF